MAQEAPSLRRSELYEDLKELARKLQRGVLGREIEETEPAEDGLCGLVEVRIMFLKGIKWLEVRLHTTPWVLLFFIQTGMLAPSLPTPN